MKKLFIFLMALATLKVSVAQIQYQNGKVILDTAIWFFLRDGYLEMRDELLYKDSLLTVQEEQIKLLKGCISAKDSIINVCQSSLDSSKKINELSRKIAEKKFYKGVEVYLGLQPFYVFDKPSSTEFPDKFQYSMFLAMNLRLSKFIVSPEIEIPLGINSKFVRLKIGYILYE